MEWFNGVVIFIFKSKFVLEFSILFFNFSSIVFKGSYGKNERPWTVLKKRKGICNGRKMNNKEEEHSQRVWFSEAATTEGWKEFVFHVCGDRN